MEIIEPIIERIFDTVFLEIVEGAEIPSGETLWPDSLDTIWDDGLDTIWGKDL